MMTIYIISIVIRILSIVFITVTNWKEIKYARVTFFDVCIILVLIFMPVINTLALILDALVLMFRGLKNDNYW